MLCVVDHHDSFTYNLVHYLHELGAEVRVILHDAMTAEEILALAPTHLLLSPGAGPPRDACTAKRLVALAAERQVPTLGVCLGHQVIGEVFGARVRHAREVVHGKRSQIWHEGAPPFFDLPSPFFGARYHSLVIDPASVPECLEVTAWTAPVDRQAGRLPDEPREVMGVRHRSAPIFGVQFHPESILSEHGHTLLEQFLRVGSGSGERRGA